MKLMYVDQSRDSLNAGNTVYEELAGGRDEVALGTREVNARAYCSWYNFRGADQQKKVGDLSGGERNRLQLAKTLAGGGCGKAFGPAGGIGKPPCPPIVSEFR